MKCLPTALSLNRQPLAFEDHQASSEIEGCVRLCCQLTQERLQHPHRLHPLSGELQLDQGFLHSPSAHLIPSYLALLLTLARWSS